MRDILDGVFTGEMTPEETILQLEYRAGIHLSYINLLNEQPSGGWEIYGSEEWHRWAVNGYTEGIKHIQENFSVRCTSREAFATILKLVMGRIR